MARAVKRSWSRWRPSLSLETWCLWPAFSSRAPTETPCSSASKMPRYVWPHHSHFLRMKSFEEEYLKPVCLCFFQLSVVEYDPGTHDLKTLSLHYFEEPELRVCTVFWGCVELLICVLMALCCVCLDGFRKGLFRMCTSPWCVWIRRTAALSCWCTAPVWWFCPSGGTRWPMNRKASWERGMSKYFLLFCRHDLLLLQCFCHLFDRK